MHASLLLRDDGSVGRDRRLFGWILLSYWSVVGHSTDVHQWKLLPGHKFEHDCLLDQQVLPKQCNEFAVCVHCR